MEELFFYKCTKNYKTYVSADPLKIRALKPMIYNVFIIVQKNKKNFINYGTGRKKYINNIIGSSEALTNYKKLIGRTCDVIFLE